SIRAVGTSALRDALNAADLAGRIRHAADIHIDVITEREEARLIMEGVLATPGVREDNVAHYVLVDIGGGSTEVIATRGGREPAVASMPLAAVRVTDKFFPGRLPSPEQIDRADRHIERTLARELKGLPLPAERLKLLGGGGTPATLCRMVRPGL